MCIRDRVMIHSLFGRRVNTPLSLLLQEAARAQTGQNVGCVDEEDGILPVSYTHLDVYKRQAVSWSMNSCRQVFPISMLPEMSLKWNSLSQGSGR